jgi:catechol 2,3-dioxygenase-like lactoylglutathione lyase family enzyme
MRIKRLTPMLNVSDIERSLDFYQKLAGFELVSPREKVAQWRWAWIKSGDGELMLSESGGPATRVDQSDSSRDKGWPAIYYFYPENVVDLHAEVKRQAFQVSDLRVTFYGMKEFEVQDPDGHILWFGQETDEPPTPERHSR